MAEIGTDIQMAARLLRMGELVAIPTETVYGLAANGLNPEAVIKVFEVKKRPRFDPLILHFADADSTKQYVHDVPPLAYELMDNFWPGPMTLVLPRRPVVSDLVTSGLENVAVRVPAHPMTRELLAMLDFPLAAPSANPFGYVSPTTAAHVNGQLGNDIGYIVDGGQTTVGLESTIIGFEDGHAVIYRLGGLSPDVIEAAIGKVSVAQNLSSDPKAPGMMKSHYSPSLPLYLGVPGKLIADMQGMRIGFLGFVTGLPFLPDRQQLVLSPKGDLHEAAKNLFGHLRKFEEMNVDVIVAEELPDLGLGRAINDRLRRAAVNT